MILLVDSTLVLRFPEVHDRAVREIDIQRTLRIPDDSHLYALPPGLGKFPLKHVDDYTEKAPPNWAAHGGVFLPMYQTEALWLRFKGRYPMAIKVAVGKINAVNGEDWKDGLSAESQDYLVIPRQPWLDGIRVSEGVVRQFVAMPLGEGFTPEEQIKGTALHGGLQIIVYPMKATVSERYGFPRFVCYSPRSLRPREARHEAEMALAPGGTMHQEIYEDEYGIDSWDTSVQSRCFVHILNSLQYLETTGERPPAFPPTAAQYTYAGLPWFEHFDAERKALRGSNALSKLKSLAENLEEDRNGLSHQRVPGSKQRADN